MTGSTRRSRSASRIALNAASSSAIEALALAIAGALLGALLAWVILDGSMVSTMTGDTPSQLTFQLEIGAGVTAMGIATAAAIALLGGMLAAIRAARVSVATALQMV